MKTTLNLQDTPTQGQSIRAHDGMYRIKYDPEWTPSRPYCVYVKGTAGACYGGLAIAMSRFPQVARSSWSEWT